jgi:uncharacterized membrane protein
MWKFSFHPLRNGVLQACKLIMLRVRKEYALAYPNLNPIFRFCKGECSVSKSMSLFFAVLSVILMSATAISISINAWLAVLFFVLTMCSIGSGFVYKAKMERRRKG